MYQQRLPEIKIYIYTYQQRLPEIKIYIHVSTKVTRNKDIYTCNMEALPRCEHSISVWPVQVYIFE